MQRLKPLTKKIKKHEKIRPKGNLGAFLANEGKLLQDVSLLNIAYGKIKEGPENGFICSSPGGDNRVYI